MLWLVSNTTNEYPETIRHIRWEKEENGTNLTTVFPIDAKGKIWTFKKVVEHYGYPMFQAVSNAILFINVSASIKTRNHSIDYIERNFKKYSQYKELPISDKCCDRLKKEPLLPGRLVNLDSNACVTSISCLKATSAKRTGWNMAAMYFTNIKTTNQDLSLSGRRMSILEYMKSTM